MTHGLESGAKSMEDSDRPKAVLYVYIFGVKKEMGQGCAAVWRLAWILICLFDVHSCTDYSPAEIPRNQWTKIFWFMALCTHHSS